MLREWLSARLRGFVEGPQKGSFSAKKNRALLLERQREISQRLDGLFANYQKRMNALSRRIRGLDDPDFMREASAIHEAQRTVVSVLSRAELAEQETRHLIDEWRDWERLSAYASVPHAERGERQELLRSELALRGVDVTPRAVSFEEEKDEPTLLLNVQPIIQNEPLETEDHLEEWSEMQAEFVPETVAYWNERMQEALSADILPDTEVLYALVKRFRDAHGEQRLLDRKNGQRRFRLEAFN